MKYRYLFFIFFSFKCLISNAQVGFGTANPLDKTVIEMSSINKGFLIPRVTDLTAILSPANALTVYNISSVKGFNPGFYYFDARPSINNWVKFGDRQWSINGNSGTSPLTDFIGTFDDRDLIFKRNNVQSALINSSLFNTSFGVGALNPVTAGNNNTAIGFESLFKNTTGNYNLAIGSLALYNNLSGNHNIAAGYKALYGNASGITGNDNIAIGSYSLENNSAGSDNIAIGGEALRANTIGEKNLGIGFQSIRENTSGNNNVGVGYMVLYNNNGNENVAIGSKSLYRNQNGNENVAIGSNSIYSNISGSYNLANGVNSLNNHTDGDGNTAVGFESLKNHTSGSNNTAFGMGAGANLQSGSNNLAFGSNTNFASQNADGQLNIANIIFGTELASPTAKIGIATSAPNSTLHIAGSIATNIRAITAGGPYTILETDYTILIDVANNIALPNASLNSGKIFYLINHRNGPCVITGTLRENGVNSGSISIATGGVAVQSTGAQWIVINRFN